MPDRLGVLGWEAYQLGAQHEGVVAAASRHTVDHSAMDMPAQYTQYALRNTQDMHELDGKARNGQ